MCQNYNGLSCQSSKCSCLFTDYWDGNTCQAKLTVNSACSGTYAYTMCQNYNGLNCSSGICNCVSTQYWNGSICSKLTSIF